MNLSPHFTLHEFIVSQTAARRNIDNTPSDDIIENLRLVAYTLEIVRARCGDRPVVISSGYRCTELNERVGGSETSKHMEGFAADFIIPDLSISDIIARIQNRLGYDQLINEFGQWVHIGLSSGQYRQHVFSIGV